MTTPTKQEVEDQKSIEELLNSMGETEEKADSIVNASLNIAEGEDGPADGHNVIELHAGHSIPPDTEVTVPDPAVEEVSERPSSTPSRTRTRPKPRAEKSTPPADLLASLAKKAPRGKYNRRLELFGSTAIQEQVDALITDVYARTGLRLYYTRIAAYAVETWLASNPRDLTDIPDLSGTANLSAKVPETVKDEFLRRIYAIDRKVPYSHVALHALTQTLDELRESFLGENQT